MKVTEPPRFQTLAGVIGSNVVYEVYGHKQDNLNVK